MGPNLDTDYYTTPERTMPTSLYCGVESEGKSTSSVDPLFCDTTFSCATSFEPRTGPSPLDLLVPKGKYRPKGGGGTGGKGWAAALAPGEGDNTAACTGHLDQKFNTLSKGGEWLPMQLNGVHKGLLIVCEGPFSVREKTKVGYLNTSLKGGNAQLEVDGAGPAHYQRKLSKSLCSVVSDQLSPGDHTLAFKAMGPELTGFSHVIWA
jgi:hypothetical protein